METEYLWLLCAVFGFAAIIYAILEFFTCVLRPRSPDEGYESSYGPGIRRKRLLSLYEIYKPSDQDIKDTIVAVPPRKRASIPTTVETISEHQEEFELPPPPYSQVVMGSIPEVSTKGDLPV